MLVEVKEHDLMDSKLSITSMRDPVQILEVAMTRAETVGDLRRHLSARLNFPEQRLCLAFGSHLLDRDDLTLWCELMFSAVFHYLILCRAAGISKDACTLNCLKLQGSVNLQGK